MATEKRLIDANALRQTMESNLYWGLDSDGAILDTIDEAPTVDAVEVVRCGKCLYYSETTGKDSGKPCGYGVCTKPFHISYIVTNEDFCSFGQKRIGAKMDGDGDG